jgi:hypothetical protein
LPVVRKYIGPQLGRVRCRLTNILEPQFELYYIAWTVRRTDVLSLRLQAIKHQTRLDLFPTNTAPYAAKYFVCPAHLDEQRCCRGNTYECERSSPYKVSAALPSGRPKRHRDPHHRQDDRAGGRDQLNGYGCHYRMLTLRSGDRKCRASLLANEPDESQVRDNRPKEIQAKYFARFCSPQSGLGWIWLNSDAAWNRRAPPLARHQAGPVTAWQSSREPHSAHEPS